MKRSTDGDVSQIALLVFSSSLMLRTRPMIVCVCMLGYSKGTDIMSDWISSGVLLRTATSRATKNPHRECITLRRARAWVLGQHLVT
jgi:hypothetical protein